MLPTSLAADRPAMLAPPPPLDLGRTALFADLDGVDTIARPHLAEALAYRALHDRLQVAA